MKKFSTLQKATIATGIALMGSIITLTCSSVALFVSTINKTGNLSGQVGLRSYFEKGTGTETDPYVISRPVHFYNLSRLQNLGVFESKKYFSLGYDPDGGSNLRFYKSDSSSETQDYLDMSPYTGILSIGSEGTPFYGVFEGNSMEIRSLTISSDPEDVGVFGYTASGSIVRNVFFNNLTVKDDGYKNSLSSLNGLYTSTSTDVAHLGSVSYDGTDISKTFSSFTDLTKSFTVTKPTATWGTQDVTYELRCSSDYFTIQKGDDHYTVTINSSNDPSDPNDITHNADFKGDHVDDVTPNGTDNAQFSTRFSIVSSVFESSTGLSYFKIVSSFTVVFVNSVSTGVSIKVATDSTDDTDDSPYAHGNNIGFVAGHCDGSLTDCYIYQGHMVLNSSSSSQLTKVAQESQTGLVGEIGPGIDNKYSPGKAYDTSGDTGIINFTKMYSNIVGDSSFTSAGDVATGYYYKFNPPVGTTLDPGTAAIFAKYLRTNQMSGDDFSYVTNTTNSVDFAGQKIIQDNDDSSGTSDGVNRGLGVFKLATGNQDNSGASNFSTGFGDFTVSKQTTFTDFYYTTAEYQDSDPLNGVNGNKGTSNLRYWTSTQGEHLHLGKALPSYTDDYTWNPFVERHFNYMFHCSLSSTATSNYFYNTNSAFLQKYFSYKLVGQNGATISPGDSDFGLFVKDSDTETGVISNISSLDSCLTISAPTNYYVPVRDASLDPSEQVPSNCIEFSIASDYANVTVLASSGSGSSNFVGVYDKSISLNTTYNVQPTGSNSEPADGKKYATYRRPSYAMYVPSYNTDRNNFCSFEYDYSTGSTSNYATFPSSNPGSSLFAHTFKLPKGEYYIGAPDSSIKIYYVCAQGQNGKGNYGNQSNVFSDTNVIDNVDFISTDPATYKTDLAASPSVDDRLYVSFEALFDSSSSTLDCTYGSNTFTISKPTGLTNLLIYNVAYKSVTFNGTTSTDRFIVYPEP